MSCGNYIRKYTLLYDVLYINIFIMDNINFLIFIFIIKSHPIISISNHHIRAINPNDYSNSNVEIPPDKIRWEIGLREATYQALRRERISQPRLKDEIYSAPIIGFQDSATPFGDIAILARGQLYSTPIGYKFVQEAYRNDCDDCHKPHRCTNDLCKPHRDANSKSLIALWTVKRIRHRDLNSGHRYELQFTVSPMSPAAPKEFVTRNGHFDYNIPGHVFIIKVKNPGQTSRLNYNRSEKYKSDLKVRPPYWSIENTNHHPGNLHHSAEKNHPSGDTFNPPTHSNLNEFTPNAVNLQTGEFYSLNKKPLTDPNHTGYLIGISNDFKPDTQITEHSHERPFVTTQDRFIKTHERLQKEPIKHYHHHFYIPEVSDIDLDKKNEQTNHRIPQTDQIQSHQTHKHIKSNENTHKFILTTGGLNSHVLQQSTQKIPSLTTDQAYAFKTTYPDTTIPIHPVIFSPSTKFHTLPTFSPGHETVFKIISIPTATQSTPFHPSPIFIQYSEPDPTYSNNEPPTVAGYITSINPTTESIKQFLSHTPEISTIKLFDPQTEIPTTTQKEKFPDSINAQLPPPKNGADTTIPYVSSTTVVSITPRPTKLKVTDSETIGTNIQVSRPTEHEELTTIKSNTDTTKLDTIKLDTTKLDTTKLDITKLDTTTIKWDTPTDTTEPYRISDTTKLYKTSDTTKLYKTSDTTKLYKTSDTTRLYTTENIKTDATLDKTDVTNRFDTSVKSDTTTQFTAYHSEHTEYLTTPSTKYLRPTESTTLQNKIERYQTDTTTTLPLMNDMPSSTTTQLSTTRKRYGKPYNYRPSYVDDLDIFADNKTVKTTKATVVTTDRSHDENEEVFPTTQTKPTLTTELMRNQRISKYLKYKQRNRYNKYRSYNSERLRQRQNTTRNYDELTLQSLQELAKPTDILKTEAVQNEDDKVETKTSQSLITSISFKVNRGGRKRYNEFARPAIIPANSDRSHRPYYRTSTTKEYNIFKELPETTTEMQYTKAFDDIARTLVNHARAASYLESETTNPPTTTTNSHK